jgi:hypothetical protein
MRETCARVLAAALMIGAIATVVAMSALYRTPTEGSMAISAPASSQQRSVRLTAHLARRHRPSAARLVTAHTTYVRPAPKVAAHSLAVVRRRRASRPPRRQLTAAPAPAPAAAPTPPSGPPPAAAVEQPAAGKTDSSDGPGKHGRGHAYGHDKQDD